MIYTVKRFSYQDTLRDNISTQVDSGLGKIEDISTKITEDPRIKDLRPVKRHGRFIKNIAKLLRRKKKKEYSDTKVNKSEVAKFKTELERIIPTK